MIHTANLPMHCEKAMQAKAHPAVKHIFATVIAGVRYRDPMNQGLGDEEFETLTGKKGLPSYIKAYHYVDAEQWAGIEAMPVYEAERSLAAEMRIYASDHGACRICDWVPADGLWQGKRVDWNRTSGVTGAALVRPYRGYVCEQCAANMEEESGEAGQWIDTMPPRKKKEGKSMGWSKNSRIVVTFPEETVFYRNNDKKEGEKIFQAGEQHFGYYGGVAQRATKDKSKMIRVSKGADNYVVPADWCK